MTAVTNIWRQLVQRRLWPVAILLIAALAAVPLALAKDPAPEPAPQVAAAPVDDGRSELAETPVVALASEADRDKRRRVLGKQKNPFFVPAPPPSGEAPTEGSSTGSAPSDSGKDGGSSAPSGGAGDPGTASPAPSAPVTPATPAPPKKTYDLYDLTVRFGDATASPQRMTLKRLQPLPSAENPVLIYMGVLRDGRTAVFLVENDAQAIGDGQCRPSADACETIRMTIGETEFFDVLDEAGVVTAQYQLDLVKIHKGSTTSASRARASYAGTSDGRRVLRSHVDTEGPTGYRLDPASGTLRRADGDLGTLRTSTALLNR